MTNRISEKKPMRATFAGYFSLKQGNTPFVLLPGISHQLTFTSNLHIMKPLLVIVCCLLCTVLSAQECKGYYYLHNGEVEMTMYDRKNEVSGVLKYKIDDVSSSGNATLARFQSEMFNNKGETLSKSSGSYKCEAGILFVDARVAMPGDQAAQLKDTEVKGMESYIEYPADLAVGQSLKDAGFKMDVDRAGGLPSTVNFEETNRKVVAKESVTTPAGTWDCWKITYNATMKVTMGGIGIPVRMQGTEWFAPGFGIVKSETNNKNGKLMGSMMISKVQK
ncbi:MAG: hypothetical protein ABWZ25_09265 [Chitinophagaceae bacterium]